MRKKALLKNKIKGEGPYSPEAKAQMLFEFDRQVAEGKNTIPDIVASLQASPATIYRWLSQRNSILSPRNQAGYMRKVNAAIEDLCSRAQLSQAALIEAIFIFVVWMRWPHRPDYMHMGVAAFLSAYFANGDPQRSIAELDSEAMRTLCKYVRLSDLKMLCCEAPFDVPLYERYEIDDDNFDDGDVVAAITWVLVNLGRHPSDPRKSASLNKAFYLIQDGCLDIKWIVGRRYLDKLWKECAPAAPFIYVERYDSPFNWSLSPMQSDLHDYVDDILTNPAERRTFFSRSRHAMDAIIQVLDPRAVKDVRFPTTRILDPACFLTRYPLSPTIQTALRDYGRSSKYLR